MEVNVELKLKYSSPFMGHFENKTRGNSDES